MPRQLLYRPRGSPQHGQLGAERVLQHMGRYILDNLGPIGDPLHNFLHLPGPDEPGIVHSEVMLHQGLNSPGHGHHPIVRPFPIRSSLTLNSEGFLLP